MSFQWPSADVETPIVEFRSYRLHPGRRNELIALFEQRFIEPQDAVGARVLGTFTVAGEPDRFVWLRGFTDMASRRAALGRFYGGPVRRAHGDAANATMIDSDDVHLVRAVAPQGGLPPLYRLPRAGETIPAARYTLLVSEVRYQEWIGAYHLWLRLFLRKAGVDPLASFATLEVENDFPALPVWRDRTMHLALIASDKPLPPLPAELRDKLRGAQQTLVLTPTARSRLR